jgi:hypothetical protein
MVYHPAKRDVVGVLVVLERQEDGEWGKFWKV